MTRTVVKRKTKSGVFRYYDLNNKRISKENYFKRLKISKSVKKANKKVNQKSKVIPRVSSKKFDRKIILSPDKNREFTVDQIRLHVGSELMNSELEVYAAIEFIREDLINLIKKNVRVGQLFTLGYNFTFHWKDGVFEDISETKQQGFRKRTELISSKISEIEIDLSNLTDEIAERFNKYLSRNFCTGVTLDDIILEVQHGKTRSTRKIRKSKRNSK